MTKKELLQKKITELRSMAKELGLSLPRGAKKEEIAAAISRAMRLKTLRKKPLESRPSKIKVRRKAEIEPEVGLKPLSVEEERPISEILPSEPVITKNLLGLVPVDQQHFYLYWEINKETFSLISRGRFLIRVYEISHGRDISQAPFFDLYIQQEAGGFHIDMGRTGDFCAEMGIIEDGKFKPFIRSNIIRLPGPIPLKELPEVVKISFPSGIVHPTSP